MRTKKFFHVRQQRVPTRAVRKKETTILYILLNIYIYIYMQNFNNLKSRKTLQIHILQITTS